jgi:hypothetical protein
MVAKEQENAVDEALWVAIPIIEGRAELVARMAEYGGAAAKLSPRCMRMGPSNSSGTVQSTKARLGSSPFVVPIVA